MCVVLVYVDLLIIGYDVSCIEALKLELDTQFTTNDLVEMRFFLGIQVPKTSTGTTLNQRMYINVIIVQDT